MDILDIILAKVLTPQEAISVYAERAQRAANNATAAQEAASTAQTAAENAASAAADAESRITNLETTIDDEVDKLLFELLTTTSDNVIINNLHISYPSNEEDIIQNINRYYTEKGDNTDGTMTQAAITTELTDLDNRVTYLEEHGTGPSPEPTPAPVIDDIVGVKINYANKTFTPIEKSTDLTPGSLYDYLPMYGGRTRCNVSDDGTITAFTDQDGYTEDGSNGQVMVYQPKFYYKRTPLRVENNVIIEETFTISAEPHIGYKLHPLFYDENGRELDYVLISAYEGSIYDNSIQQYITDADTTNININEDKLSSIYDVKPQADINIENFETLAQNRGNGWHIMNLLTCSVNQLLFSIEYAALNSQTALNLGITQLTRSETLNFSSNTGSTSILHNASGRAVTTKNITNNTTVVYNTDDTCAISYRGVENLWGNIWKFVGGLYSKRINNQEKVYLCPNYNYSNLNNYIELNYVLPNTSSWTYNFSYISDEYDWILLPTIASTGTSLLPIGDYIWIANNTNNHSCLIGGSANHTDMAGLFNYAFDQDYTESRNVRNARLIYIPNKNSSNYTTNYENWQQYRYGR